MSELFSFGQLEIDDQSVLTILEIKIIHTLQS